MSKGDKPIVFGSSTTSEDVMGDIDLKGKVYVVTGTYYTYKKINRYA